MQTETNLLQPVDEQAAAAASAQADMPANADGRPANLPEKFWDPKKGEVRLDALIRSYVELERKLSGMLPAPNDEDSKKRLMRALGVPETPDAYELKLEQTRLQPDADLNRRLHERGFTTEQVQLVYELASEKLVPMILDIAAEFQAEREIERLSEAFGGQEKWRETSRQLLAYGKKNLPPAVLSGMSSSYDGVMALYRMMQGDDPSFAQNAKTVSGNSEAELFAMMRDPKYWRDKDPAFIAKVTEGFKGLYSS